MGVGPALIGKIGVAVGVVAARRRGDLPRRIVRESQRQVRARPRQIMAQARKPPRRVIAVARRRPVRPGDPAAAPLRVIGARDPVPDPKFSSSSHQRGRGGQPMCQLGLSGARILRAGGAGEGCRPGRGGKRAAIHQPAPPARPRPDRRVRQKHREPVLPRRHCSTCRPYT
jgi:hypothetical protein